MFVSFFFYKYSTYVDEAQNFSFQTM